MARAKSQSVRSVHRKIRTVLYPTKRAYPITRLSLIVGDERRCDPITSYRGRALVQSAPTPAEADQSCPDCESLNGFCTP